ncbi:MAG: hypothetical protein HY906_20940 [Deltaproteobacteria bacterium]|nr:hypothetical protein [Deltaproteobacteria bacterium]
MSRFAVVVSFLTIFSLAGCGGGGTTQADAEVLPPPCGDLCVEKPACGNANDPQLRAGPAATMINKLAIGTYEEGFDFNEDGKIDNSLAALGALANNPIKDSLKKGEIIVPFEFFDLEPDAASFLGGDLCVHFAVYMGKYPQDADEDGVRAGNPADPYGDAEGDCNDRAGDPLAKSIKPGAPEVAANKVDDNCNGLADETQVPLEQIPDAGCNAPSRLNDGGCLTVPDDTDDADGDGVTVAQGDCDDRATPVIEIVPDAGAKPIGWYSKPGAKEVCGDGLDNDCNGFADDGCNPYCDPKLVGTSNPAACTDAYITAHGDTLDAVAIDPLSVGTDGLTPRISFVNGVIQNGRLLAGPSVFALNIPLTEDMNLDFRITAALIDGQISVDGRGGVSLTDTVLGGVLGAKDLANIKGLDVSDINLTPEDSLLDVVFVAFLAKANLLGLKQIHCHPLCPPDGCLIPDIDVDGDGYECFIDDDPDDGFDRVTLCVDGDGTEVRNNWDGTGKNCTQKLGANGKAMFVDGLSISLKFSTLPVRIGALEPPAT